MRGGNVREIKEEGLFHVCLRGEKKKGGGRNHNTINSIDSFNSGEENLLKFCSTRTKKFVSMQLNCRSKCVLQ